MQEQLIPNLFRTEYSKLTAVLAKKFGLANIQVAEDIVSETFILAAETWGKKGVPDNQLAWLYTVAKNKTKDYLKRNKLFREKIEPDLKHLGEKSMEMELDLSDHNITDSQLQMLFAVCHPSIPSESQIGLALRILCGFGIGEIAEAFLSNKETINKRLHRAKERLRKEQIAIEFPPEAELPKRLDSVLRTLYLLFNEGYYSASPNETLRKDFCRDAMRLNLLLLQYPPTNQPKVNALLSLMCFHASRFDARLNEDGNFILYHEQDTSRWENALIEQGEVYLNRASTGDRLSKYHLEAAIAYWHTQRENEREKWENILQLYNLLLQVEYSPMAALNRTYALAQAEGKAVALIEAKKIKLEQNHLYHCLLAELYDTDHEQALEHLKRAQQLAKSEGDQALITQKIEAIS